MSELRRITSEQHSIHESHFGYELGMFVAVVLVWLVMGWLGGVL